MQSVTQVRSQSIFTSLCDFGSHPSRKELKFFIFTSGTVVVRFNSVNYAGVNTNNFAYDEIEEVVEDEAE